MVRAPTFTPLEVGVAVTLTVQDAPAASVGDRLLQGLPPPLVTLNWLASGPEIVMLLH